MVANNLTPAYPTHPGEIIKDEVEYRGISQRQLAKQMGIANSALNENQGGCKWHHHVTCRENQ